ncbi:MAG: hypothetical protein N2112_02505 [Gemmataceae bacterium]|nr:hypothetical protein [Gemmataceae bacterium]
MKEATANYTMEGLVPYGQYDAASTINVMLPASKYLAKGTVLGQVAGSGTAVNEVQTVTITGSPTGGTFRLQYDGETTSAIAHNATAAAVQAALEALPSIGIGNVVCSGGTLPGTAVTVTFQNYCGGLNHPLLVAISSLTGGTSPAVVVAKTTAGNPAAGFFDAYDDTATNGLHIAKAILQYDCRTDAQGKIYFGQQKSADNGKFSRTAPAFISGVFQTKFLVGLDANGVTDLGRLILGSSLSADATLIKIS